MASTLKDVVFVLVVNELAGGRSERRGNARPGSGKSSSVAYTTERTGASFRPWGRDPA